MSLFSEKAKYGTKELKAGKNTGTGTIHKSEKSAEQKKTVNDCVGSKLATAKPWFHQAQSSEQSFESEGSLVSDSLVSTDFRPSSIQSISHTYNIYDTTQSWNAKQSLRKLSSTITSSGGRSLRPRKNVDKISK